MRSRKSKIVLIALIGLLLILACKSPFSKEVGLGPTVKEVVSENTALIDEGVTLVQAYQVSAANHFLRINACYAKMDSMVQSAKDYSGFVNANIESWTGNFKDQEAELNNQIAEYLKAGGDPTKLNLAQLQANGALPSDLQTGMLIYVQAVTQAPPPSIDPQIWRDVLAAKSECYESIVFTGGIVNDKAGQYNTWHNTVKGKLVTEANDIFTQVTGIVGFVLPEFLPFVTGGSATDAPLR
ncbi:hypothetical protein CO104_01270 [Candidatus Collierbacteria bacterium CG_4_9_14_3_um_filter_43_16]|uniref:Uncharacterized protein n=1 Tax=Candidatus Collierbacteria bacterium CG_4_9_14_3_um_filter_43_16 TaxID=1974532 RepID=A0A2M8BX66_9BACT|nr:MAG: hypothetical protein CO104_01270 [Candidatus Collierbacteria bacterium CG_4_9_14_3_um_filter_43_16]